MAFESEGIFIVPQFKIQGLGFCDLNRRTAPFGPTALQAKGKQMKTYSNPDLSDSHSV